MRRFILLGCLLAVLHIAPSISRAQCLGDFNGDGTVSISELITAVGNALTGCQVGADRFVDNGDGTVTDHQTGLMWEKKDTLDGTMDFANLHDADDYYQWAGICSVLTSKYCQPSAAASALCTASAEGTTGCAQCTGGEGVCSATTTVWTWVAALNTANFAGHSDWRLAKLSELQSIVDYSDGAPPAVNVAFQGASCGGTCTDITNAACSCTQPNRYWSASTYAPLSESAWIVYFFDGLLTADVRLGTYYVRAIRSGS